MDMRNRVTRLMLSSNGAGNQPQAQTGEIAQEANAPANLALLHGHSHDDIHRTKRS
jgi:hypothetical protein